MNNVNRAEKAASHAARDAADARRHVDSHGVHRRRAKARLRKARRRASKAITSSDTRDARDDR